MLQPHPITASPSAMTGRFAFVDALRGIAALLVAVHHIERYGPLRESASVWIPDFLREIAFNGKYGVQMFFVISGFVIAYSIRGAWITPGYLGSFALRRAIRLDPPYWTAIACVLALHAFAPLFDVVPSPFEEAEPQAVQAIAHLFYLQNILGFENLSVGFWTLCIEVQFYLLLVILTGVAQRFTAAGSSQEKGASGPSLLLVFAPLALVSLFFFHLDHAYDNWVIRFLCMFFLGALAWWTLEGRLPSRIFWLYVLVVVGRLAFAWALDLAIALATGVSIYLVGRAGRLHNCCNASWLQFLGRVSYSLYLIHYPVSHIVVNVGYYLTGESTVAAVLWLIVALAASLAAAHGLYVLVEAPSVRLAARFKHPWRESPGRTPALAEPA